MSENLYIKNLKQKYKDRVCMLQDCGDRVELIRPANGQSGVDCLAPGNVAAGLGGFLDLVRIHGLHEMLDNGVKAIQFGQDYADAFMLTDPNICPSDYSQPYDVMMVDFPDNFIQEHFRRFGGDDQLARHPSPKTAMVVFEPREKILFIEVTLANGTTCLNKLFPKLEGDLCEAIEDNRLRSGSRTPGDDGAEISDAESKVMSISARVAINAVLAADGRMDEKGYENPAYAEKLDRYISKADTDKKRFQATLDKQTLPFILNYHRSTVTYHRSSAPSDGDPTGRTVGPHWRRGHYRIQRFGAGLQESKRIRIAPVFVNLHLVPAGFNLGDTVTDYRVNNPDARGWGSMPIGNGIQVQAN